jgi:hypothetical protein
LNIGVAPNRFEQLLLRDEAAGMIHEIFKDGIYLGFECDSFPRAILSSSPKALVSGI